MGRVIRVVKIVTLCAVAAAVAAAAGPAALSQAEGGLWEISRQGEAPVQMCIADPSTLAQFEHRGRACTGVAVREAASSLTIHYTCTGGGFGQSEITVITPRSLRVQTQGISDSLPFNYVFQARRLQDCTAH